VPASALQECAYDVDGGGFPCPVGPEKSKNFALLYIKIYAFDGVDVSHMTYKVQKLDYVRQAFPSLLTYMYDFNHNIY
jgi:hypothetical protein